jgi:4'-phosphopantetheinyl transferase
VLICSVDSVYSNDCFERLLMEVSAGFRLKLNRFKRREDAIASLLGRLLLRYGLAKFLGHTFEESSITYSDYGKPLLVDSGVNFSISHSGQLVACAICRNEQIGVDLEQIKHVELEVFKEQMTAREWSLLQHLGTVDVFYTMWTRKEAVVKAVGRGLHIPLRSFDVMKEATRIDDNEYYVYNIPVESDYSCSLAIGKDIDEGEISIHRVVLEL